MLITLIVNASVVQLGRGRLVRGRAGRERAGASFSANPGDSGRVNPLRADTLAGWAQKSRLRSRTAVRTAWVPWRGPHGRLSLVPTGESAQRSGVRMFRKS